MLSKLGDFAEHYGAQYLRVNLTSSQGRNNLHQKKKIYYRIIYNKTTTVKADKMGNNENGSQGDRSPIFSYYALKSVLMHGSVLVIFVLIEDSGLLKC